MEVRTRFAPSPTGYLHIGGLRTALYAWLFAKKNNGTFVLRIEDTDQERYVEGSVEIIYSTLRAAGLTYGEGPDVGGGYGPYIQSERKHRGIYKHYAEELVRRGGAYYCFCTKERLDSVREETEMGGGTFKYDKHCLHLSEEEVKSRLEAGEPYVIRQNIPEEGTTTFSDLIYGDITVENATLDDNVLLKSDGMPTYNFANVVDDHLMGITHIIRGTEYLSSTPKYNMLYAGFGWDIPQYIHLPPVMKDAHRKLSKRHGDASFEDFTSKGYLPDAIVNYIALLGWNPGYNQEIFTLSELAEAFSLEGISKSPAIFDVEKLTWMNGEYIRKLMPEEFKAVAMPWYEKAGVAAFDLDIIGGMIQPRLERLGQIGEKLAFLLELPDYDISLYEHKKMKTDPGLAKTCIGKARELLVSMARWEPTALHDSLIDLATEMGVKNGQLLFSVRIALTGTEVTPGGAIEAAALLGREESLRRIGVALDKLSGA